MSWLEYEAEDCGDGFLVGVMRAAGQAWAMPLRATIPTAEAKTAAWARATTDQTLATELQGAAIAGFTDAVDT
ncbi:MAG: hypothetical protein LBK59_04540, partial [Bifidobacteriaceae bacterium]|nr:hypothetical protein [Bifidobacteriaceae bacterium]